MNPFDGTKHTAQLPARMVKALMFALKFDGKDFHLSERLKQAIDQEIQTGKYEGLPHNKAVTKAGLCLAHKAPEHFDLLNESDQAILEFARLASRPDGEQLTPEEMMKLELQNPSPEPMAKLTLSLHAKPPKGWGGKP